MSTPLPDYPDALYTDLGHSAGHSALSPATQNVLDALARVLDREGTASVRQIGEEADRSSTSTVAFQLRKLAVLGYIEEPVPGRPRGWLITRQGWTMTSAT